MMKKFFNYALALVLTLTSSFSLTSCDSDDVDTIVKIIALFTNGTADIDNTAWVAMDSNGDGIALAFRGNNQGQMYDISKSQIAEITQISYSYNSSNNILTIGGQQYTVEAFTANQSLTLKTSKGSIAFSYYDISKLPTGTSGDDDDDDDDDGSNVMSGTAWTVGGQNNTTYLYYFANDTQGALYLYDSEGQQKNVWQFTYTFDNNVINITYSDGDTETLTIISVDEANGRLQVKDANGNTYYFTYYNQSGSSRRLEF